MSDLAVLSVREFVDAVQDLVARDGPPTKVHAFLAATRLDPATLDPYVSFDPGRYRRHLVWKSPAVEILVLCWSRGVAAPIHGHEGELCWARVERGRLRFTSYREESRAPLALKALGVADGGPGHLDGPADVHAVENAPTFGEDAVSVHVYACPYDECDVYDLDRGVVERVRLEYDAVLDGR
jgi:NitT/TauT family transport system ATP-binding protein